MAYLNLAKKTLDGNKLCKLNRTKNWIFTLRISSVNLKTAGLFVFTEKICKEKFHFLYILSLYFAKQKHQSPKNLNLSSKLSSKFQIRNDLAN